MFLNAFFFDTPLSWCEIQGGFSIYLHVFVIILPVLYVSAWKPIEDISTATTILRAIVYFVG